MSDLIERAKAALDGYSKTTIDHDQWLSFTRALIAETERLKQVEAAAVKLAEAVEKTGRYAGMDLARVDKALAAFRAAMEQGQ